MEVYSRSPLSRVSIYQVSGESYTIGVTDYISQCTRSPQYVYLRQTSVLPALSFLLCS